MELVVLLWDRMHKGRRFYEVAKSTPLSQRVLKVMDEYANHHEALEESE